MLKRILAVILLAVMLITFCCACGKVTLHCDGCGKEVKCDKKMNEDWIIYCGDCEEELFDGGVIDTE